MSESSNLTYYLFYYRFVARKRVMLAWWAVTRRWRRLVWRIKGRPAPEVCSSALYGLDSFYKGQQRWRVQRWLCEAKPPTNGNWIEEILFESSQKIRGKRMRYCLPNEATHVSLYGICGTIARIDEVKITGMVSWPKDVIAAERDRALRMGAAGEVIF